MHDDNSYWDCGSTRHDASFLLRPCCLCGSKGTPRADCSEHAVCAACLQTVRCYVCDGAGVELFCVCCGWRGAHAACTTTEAAGSFRCFVCVNVRGYASKQLPVLGGAWREYQEHVWTWEVKVCRMFDKDPTTIRRPLSKIMPRTHRRDARARKKKEDEQEASESSGGEESSAPSADGGEESAASSEDIPIGELLRRQREEEEFSGEAESSSDDVPLGELAATAEKQNAVKQVSRKDGATQKAMGRPRA